MVMHTRDQLSTLTRPAHFQVYHWQTREGTTFSGSPPVDVSHRFDKICARCSFARCHGRAGPAYALLLIDHDPRAWNLSLADPIRLTTQTYAPLQAKPHFASQDGGNHFLASAHCRSRAADLSSTSQLHRDACRGQRTLRRPSRGFILAA